MMSCCLFVVMKGVLAWPLPQQSRRKKRGRRCYEEAVEAGPPIGIRQREDGKFECLADDCDYAGNTRDAIYKHVSRHHGRSVQLVKGTGPPDPQKEKNKSCVRAKRARVRRCIFEGLGPHPLVITEQSVSGTVRASVRDGTGQRDARGQFNDVGKEALDVAISMVAVNTRRLRSLFGLQGAQAELPLWCSGTDLLIEFSGRDHGKDGDSAAAASTLALICLVGRRGIKSDRVAITGGMDMRGLVGGVGGIEGKLKAFEKGITLIVPKKNYVRIERDGWSAEKLAWAQQHLKPAMTVVDVMRHAMDGFEGGAELAAALDGPHVGLAICIGRLHTDRTYMFEVQCTRVEHGSNRLICTGRMSDDMREYLDRTLEQIGKRGRALAAMLGIDWAQVEPLRSRSKDLHVHCKHGYLPVRPAYQQLPIFVSLLSLLLGRRPRKDTLTFAAFSTETGELLSEAGWAWSVNQMEYAFEMGFRRVVAAPGVVMQEEAEKAAAVVQADGRPKVELVIAKTLDEAVKLTFSEDEVQPPVAGGAPAPSASR